MDLCDRSGDPAASSSDAREDEMKRATAKSLIERYFYQLTDGCGNPTCDNKHCASSGQVTTLSPNEAAAKAIQLFSEEARLCDPHRNKMPRTNFLSAGDNSVISSIPCNDMAAPISLNDSARSSQTKQDITMAIPYLTEDSLYEIISECESSENYSKLIRTLGEVFSSIESLVRSFRQRVLSSPIDAILDKTAGDLTTLKKEDVRSLEGEKDKDEDSCVSAMSPDSAENQRLPLDYAGLRRSYSALLERLPSNITESAMVNALVTLAGYLQMELQNRNTKLYSNDDIVHVLTIIYEIPVLGNGDFLETAFPALCRATKWINVEVQAKLAQMWSSSRNSSCLSLLLENLQQLVTLRVILTQFHPDFCVQEENVVTAATKLMKVVYYANILAGVLESPILRQKPDKNLWTDPEDELALELGVHPLDCRKPLIPLTEFYNEPLSDAVEVDKDFSNYKSPSPNKFSFLLYPFILTPATKALGLYYDNRIRMFSERRFSFLQSVSGNPSNPYLKLCVRRDHIVDDALVELEMVSMVNPIDLKKQLVVEFQGEQGIDEGGVSKEFFQLVIEEIFNPDYGMFVTQPESQTMWFNPMSFETEAQFTLIGIVLGLAIYNNVILAVNFPLVLYRKLMGILGSFEDLQDWNPTLYNSLKQLLEYPDPDLEEVFMQTFRVSYQDVFGNLMHHDLVECGDSVSVTPENKYEFVKLYADYLLNKSVDKQFTAFYKGFQMVTGESPLEQFFRPEEVELLICGSKNFNFDELEDATEYDGGYTRFTMIVRNFWQIVHAFSNEDKRKLLQFATGSDRVPIGGLSKLKLVIARNGPDSDRLPTAHTCFNVLLLPEYLTKQKLKDRLLKAINYSKGFGML
ncbi:ubiquitin-protein ligase E3A isoform X2 [Atheta coriaria]|uniref:ubiquitin-protein ligase E3A isoform X2 n=1 Tax=Dalotia coriaria TaxID=877792 RepID=UPI0031F3DFBA